MTASRPTHRYVLYTVGTTGDVLPFVAVGARLQHRGHEVVLAANANFESTARAANLHFVPVGTEDQHRRALDDPDLWAPRRGLEIVMRRLVPDPQVALRLLADLVDPGRTVIVSHPFGLAPRLLQDKYGIPTATLVLSTCLFRSNHRVPTMYGFDDLSSMPRPLKSLMWRLADALLLDPAVVPRLEAARRKLGLAEIRRPFDGWLFSPTMTVGLFPEWFCPPQPDWPKSVRLTGFPLFHSQRPVPPRVERFLGERAPPVVFTPGSGAPDSSALFEAAAEACRHIGRPGLLLGGEGPDLPEATPVVHADFAPLDAVLPRSAALVHHGGIGTTGAALAAGTPQLIRPLGFDHHDHAARVGRLGVGEALEPDELDGPTLAGALGELLGAEEVRDRCEEYRRRIRDRDPVGATCQLLEETFSRSNILDDRG